MKRFYTLVLVFFLSIFLVPQNTWAQCAVFKNCLAGVASCDYTANNPQYWNALYWWDNTISTHDLAESDIDLNLAVYDTCPGDVLTVRCLLFLDLDGDGVRETVLDSDSLPPANSVNFGNAFNPNYSGGTPREFDQRPVPASQKWRFALSSSNSGDTATYRLQWHDGSVFKLPELPYGFQKVRWEVKDGTGATQACEKTFLVQDCKKPILVCLNGLSANIMPTQLITLWASDFLQYVEDNVTPASQIKIGIRKAGTGTGFPIDQDGNPQTSVTFDCTELGEHTIELWGIDAAGNADYCESYVIIQDNNGNCQVMGTLKICASTYCDDSPVEEAAITLQDPSGGFLWLDLSDAAGCASFSHQNPIPQNAFAACSKDDNPLDGLTQADILLLNQYILGITPFTEPWQYIAADANQDNVISTADYEECRKILLGISTASTWRFIDASYDLPPNPLMFPLPETIPVLGFGSQDIAFKGVKLCDLRCDDMVGFFEAALESAFSVGDPSPNPTGAGAMLPLQLATAETVLLEVFDFSGKRLFRAETNLPAGPALLELPASSMPQSGVYVWRASAGGVSRSGKIVRE